MDSIQRLLHRITSELDTDETTRRDLYDELQDHLEMSKRSHMENGLSEEDAEQKAVEDFGNSRTIGKALKKSMHPNRRIIRTLGWLLFIPYLLSVFVQTLIGGIVRYRNQDWKTLKFDHYRELFQYHHGDAYNWMPFRTITHFWTLREHYNFDIWFNNTVGNVLLFIPLGLLLPILFRSCHRASRVLGISGAIAIGIECLQFLTRSGIADVDSVLLRAGGAAVGFLCYRGAMYLIRRASGRPQAVKS